MKNKAFRFFCGQPYDKEGKVLFDQFILRGYIYASLFVLISTVFRSYIIKESTDPQNKGNYMFFLDNIIWLALFICVLLCSIFIKKVLGKKVALLIFREAILIVFLEVTFRTSKDTMRIVALFFFLEFYFFYTVNTEAG